MPFGQVFFIKFILYLPEWASGDETYVAPCFNNFLLNLGTPKISHMNNLKKQSHHSHVTKNQKIH